MAVYRLLRVIRVDEAFSELVHTIQGIAAGSGSATTEMRLIMIDVVGSECQVYPQVEPIVFVDDLSAETFSDVQRR